MNDTPWNTDTPSTPHRVYVVFYAALGGGYYGLATWTGERWLPLCDENTDAPTAWMWLPDGPTGPGAGQVKKIVVTLDPPWPTDADVDEYLKREGLRRGDGEMTCYAGDEDDGEVEGYIGCERHGGSGTAADCTCMMPLDEDFIEGHAEPGSIGAELAERLDRPGPREVLVVAAGVPDLRGVPERLALADGRGYVMVLADDDPIVKMLRKSEPMSMSCTVVEGPFLGAPVPEPDVRLPADWRERRPADEDCDGDGS